MPDHPLPTGETTAVAPAAEPVAPAVAPIEDHPAAARDTAAARPATAGAEGAAAGPAAVAAPGLEAPAEETAAATATATATGADVPEGDVAAPATTESSAAAVAAVPELSPAACAARLAELFPALFKGPPKPLKLRIQADIQQRAPGVFTKKSLSAFLHRHTTTTAYLIALTQNGQRVDLDGLPAGPLAEEHVTAAAAELTRRRSVHEARRAAENAARREAEQVQRQARAAEDDARRDRALLLRAFETSTLTRANFCALKRIAEAELDALLATARQEAAQRAQEGWQDRRPEPSHDGRGERRPDQRRDVPRGPRTAARQDGGTPGGAGPRPGAGPRRGPTSPKPQR